MSETSPSIVDVEKLLDAAIDEGSRRYFNDCRARVSPFVECHFRYPGALHTNRHAMGWDLLRAPLNLFWAPFYLLFMLLSWGCHRIGWTRIASLLKSMPAGLDTEVQDYLVSVSYRELLQRPIQEGDADGLHDAIVAALKKSLNVPELDKKTHEALSRQINKLVDEALDHYAVSRTASADIANSVISMLVGVFAFQKYTPGGLAIGLYAATEVAKGLAIDEFWAGPWLGQVYYTFVPVTPSATVTFASIAITLVLLAVVACFSGLIIDPLQALFGIHQWRLKRLISHLERDFKRKTDSSFRPKEPYLARVLDLIDAARTHLQ
ncbi:MAG: DUF6635 family protein [Amphritea sp.]